MFRVPIYVAVFATSLPIFAAGLLEVRDSKFESTSALKEPGSMVDPLREMNDNLIKPVREASPSAIQARGLIESDFRGIAYPAELIRRYTHGPDTLISIEYAVSTGVRDPSLGPFERRLIIRFGSLPPVRAQKFFDQMKAKWGRQGYRIVTDPDRVNEMAITTEWLWLAGMRPAEVARLFENVDLDVREQLRSYANLDVTDSVATSPTANPN